MNEFRVLIVEGDVFIAMNLAELVFETLAAVPIAVRSVGAASRALAADFDVVFLDVNVTDGAAFEIADILTKRGIPFTFISGSPRSEIPPRLQDAQFIGKHYDDRTIIKMLRAIS